MGPSPVSRQCGGIIIGISNRKVKTPFQRISVRPMASAIPVPATSDRSDEKKALSSECVKARQTEREDSASANGASETAPSCVTPTRARRPSGKTSRASAKKVTAARVRPSPLRRKFNKRK